MKSITQRRIFSLLLSLAMLVGLLPALGSIASAAGSGTTEGDPRIVTTYAELSSALSSGVTYVKLGANINTKDFNDGAGYNKSIQQTGTVQLDLDGYSVRFFSKTSPLPAAIRVTGDLSVKDSRGGGKLYIDANPNTASSKQVLILAETGSFTLNSGRIGVDNGLAKNSIVVVEGKGDAKVVFNGGKVDAISPKVGIPYVYSALLSSNCKAEFKGGEFEGLVGFTYATRTDGKSKPNAVINGGKFKGGDLDGMKDLLRRRAKSVNLYGASREIFEAAWQGVVPLCWHERMEDAVLALQGKVKEGDVLSLGHHELHFVMAPMVHWPEVMVTYDAKDKVLFSADGFGKFGALDVEEEWDCEARRYYIGIVGKYGAQVQALLKKAAALDIAIICPLHGPALKDNLAHYINLYDIWSSYRAESEGVMIAYTSVYGNTKRAAELLAKKLEERGCKAAISDLARCDMAEAVEDAFRYGKLVLATTTYNADIFPFMKQFIDHLTERNYQNRTIGFIENGTWAPAAAKIMKTMFEKSKNINYIDTTVTLRSAMTEENAEAIDRMAEELCR